MTSDEAVGNYFLGLETGLPVDRLVGAFTACMRGQSSFYECELDGVDRKGFPMRFRVTLVPLKEGAGDTGGAVLMVEKVTNETDPPQAL